jgi:hypothetical protein
MYDCTDFKMISQINVIAPIIFNVITPIRVISQLKGYIDILFTSQLVLPKLINKPVFILLAFR